MATVNSATAAPAFPTFENPAQLRIGIGAEQRTCCNCTANGAEPNLTLTGDAFLRTRGYGLALGTDAWATLTRVRAILATPVVRPVGRRSTGAPLFGSYHP